MIKFLQNHWFTRRIIYGLGRKRLAGFFRRIRPYLGKCDRILDIGAGTCNLEEILVKKGYKVTPIDVKNLSFVDRINPIIYDGLKIPFKNNRFDLSLILTVLHHTPDPELTIKEAMRVSKKIVIIEDIYKNSIQKYFTFIMDNLLNLEFVGNPHNNKSDREWKELFKKMKLKLKDAQYEKYWALFQSTTYYLEK